MEHRIVVVQRWVQVVCWVALRWHSGVLLLLCTGAHRTEILGLEACSYVCSLGAVQYERSIMQLASVVRLLHGSFSLQAILNAECCLLNVSTHSWIEVLAEQ